MTNEQETIELAPVWSHALATIILNRVNKTITEVFTPLTGRATEWRTKEHDTESLAKLIAIKAEAHYGNRQDLDQATITTLRERLAAAEALLSRAWVAKQSFWFHDEVCIHHPFFSSGWVAQRNPLLIGKKGTTGAEALRECQPQQFNGWGFDNPIDAYLAAVAAGWLKPQPQAETAEVEK